MNLFDPAQITTGLIQLALGSAASWVMYHVRDAVKDVNAAFDKIRQLTEANKDLKERLEALEDEIFHHEGNDK